MSAGPEALIADELDSLKEGLRKEVPDARLITCVREQVRVSIVKTEHRQYTCQMQFPQGYPVDSVLFELKSKTLSNKCLDYVTKLAEAELKKHTAAGRQQIILLLKFLDEFLEENPLCVCNEEISSIRRQLLSQSDQLKIKKRSGQLQLRLAHRNYFFSVQLDLPDQYPKEKMAITLKESNFPRQIVDYLVGNSLEISRKSVEAPAIGAKSAEPFQPKPSLFAVVQFVAEATRSFVEQTCPRCQKPALAAEPRNNAQLSTDDLFVERLLCQHLYHRACLEAYLNSPPFAGPAKNCIQCGLKVQHQRWTPLTVQVAEARWAHRQAKRRELDEVLDFLT